MNLTIAAAPVELLWPDPGDRPSPREVAEIRRLAQALDRAGEILPGYLPGVAPAVRAIYFAQDRLASQRKLEAEKAKAEAKRPPAPPQPQPVAKGSVHPSAKKWAKWPQSRTDADAAAKDKAYQQHCEDWRRNRVPLTIYRPELDERQTATISDARKLYREIAVYADILSEGLVFHLKELSQRVKALEERPTLKYHGIWAQDQTYPDNSLVSSQGSLWIAKAETRGVRPGDDNNLWEVVARKGRDGRHAAKEPK